MHHEHVRPSLVFWACISVLLKSADRLGIFLSAAAASALAALARAVAAAARWTADTCSVARARAGIGGPQGPASAALARAGIGGPEGAAAVAGTDAPRCGSAPDPIGGPQGLAFVFFGIGGPQGRSDMA